MGSQGRLYTTSDNLFYFKSTSDFVDLLKIMTRRSKIPFDIYSATWNDNRKLEYTDILTTQLMGRAFNLIEDFELLNLDRVSRDFHYNYDCQQNCNYPLKTSIGEGKGLSVEFNIWLLFFDSIFYFHKFFNVLFQEQLDNLYKLLLYSCTK